jgi:acetyl-CoA carboxylase, biotin carboxylase subunit
VAAIQRVLIANRGEIAVRIARTLRDMGIVPIAVYSEPDRGALHVRACEQAYPIGPGPAAESYLRANALLEAAKRARADAIHPGYGFLSENADFAEAVADAGLIFIGPPAAAMRVLGPKTSARQAAVAAGVPVIPGSHGPLVSLEQAERLARQLGYPVMLKAAAGGGGKGMRLVAAEAELASAWRATRSEAESAFGDGTLYLERAIVRPKHIEMQIFADACGNVVWLGERECSMQRRHQKIIEETPSPVLGEETRQQMGRVASRLVAAAGYVGAGTCEFLVDEHRAFYFLEMNTRLQVEHPITEWCCGLDLVEAQVRVAQGEALPWSQQEIERRGHAIEARLYAEDPDQGFLPCPGRIRELHLPSGPGVRVDAGVASGTEVSRYYDPLIAKLSVWAPDREHARRRLLGALSETVAQGLVTNRAFLRRLLEAAAFKDGSYHTDTVAELLATPASTPPPPEIAEAALIAAVIKTYRRDQQATRARAEEEDGHQRWRQGRPWQRG